MEPYRGIPLAVMENVMAQNPRDNEGGYPPGPNDPQRDDQIPIDPDDNGPDQDEPDLDDDENPNDPNQNPERREPDDGGERLG